MTSQDLFSQPIANSESTTHAFWGWNSHSLHYLNLEHNRAQDYCHPWQTGSPVGSTNTILIPMDLLNMSSAQCEAANFQSVVTEFPPRSRLDSNSTASIENHMLDTSTSPLTVSSEDVYTSPSKPKTARKRRARPAHTAERTAHKEVEARYRETMNAAIRTLQQAVPPLTHSDGSFIDGEQRPHLSKAAIMIGAATYIKHLEAEYRRSIEENNALRAVVARHRP